jgi:hypothetical protein
VLLDFVDATNQQVFTQHAQYITAIAFVFTRDYDNVIVFLNLAHDFPRLDPSLPT